MSHVELGLSFRPKILVGWRGGRSLGNSPGGAIEMGCLIIPRRGGVYVGRSCATWGQLPLNFSLNVHKTGELE